MPRDIDVLTDDALQLPEDQRLTLAHRLLSSIEPRQLHDIEAAWDVEIQRRIQAFDQGAGHAIPASEVFREVDERLRK